MQTLVAGIAAAIVASFAYLLFAAAFGLPAGYLSLGAGFLIAKAVKTAARGQSGRRFQFIALVLTYLVVTISAVPVVIAPAPLPSASGPVVSMLPVSAMSAPHLEVATSRLTESRIAELPLSSLLSPALRLRDPVRGVIDVVILFAGLNIAWRKSTVVPKRRIDKRIYNFSDLPGVDRS